MQNLPPCTCGPRKVDPECPLTRHVDRATTLRHHPPINGCTVKGDHPCKLGTPEARRTVVDYGAGVTA